MGAIEGQQVFELRHILAVENIQLSARSQANNRQLIALVTQNGDLVLYYTNGESLPVLRRVPWFLEREKRITSLSFHPAGTWLLITGWDGFVHIVPALSLVDPSSVSDQSWNPLDLTSFPAVTASPPTCCVWWQSTALGHQMGLIGTEAGDIALINLNTGQRLGSRKISGSLSMLHVCHDNSDSAYLLMTCEDRQQWRVLLEDRDGSWFWPEEQGKISSRSSVREEINGISPAPSTRSRLQGLKQMSVEKLAIIRQRLAETRSKTTAPSLSTNSNVTSRRGSSSSDGSARSSDTSSPSSSSVPQIENLRWIVNAFLWPQTVRGRQVLSAYHAQSNFISMYKIEDLEQPPAYGHKIMFPCRDMLVTERFLYLTDSTAKRFTVVSSKLSESRRHDDLDHNPDAMVDLFEFNGEERILALYKVSNSRTFLSSSVPVVSASGSSSTSDRYMQSEAPQTKSIKDVPKSHEQWLEQEIERLRGQPVDTCIVVTSHGVYHVVLKQCAVKKVLNHLLAGVDPEKAGQLLCAESLSRMFGLDLQRLLELAGDIQLSKGSYIKAIELYKLARCRQIKWIVKLAAGGHSAQLLIALQEGALTANSQDASPLERCQLSNLAVLCQAQQYLSTQSPDIHKGFIKFLKSNQYYDEQMAVNILGQNHLWPFLKEMASYRGLFPEVLEAQAKMMSHALAENDITQKQKLMLLITQPGFWESISEGCLREAFLQRPQLVRIHTSFIKSCLDLLELDVIMRLAALYDPTDPALRPGLHQLLRSSRSREGSNERELSVSFDSASISSYSSDFVETSMASSENVAVMEDLALTFLLLLLQIWHKNHSTEYRPDLSASTVRLPKRVNEAHAAQGVEVLSLVTCELSAGFGHAALVRNSGLFMWGRNDHGCLGIGPSMVRFSQPRPVLTFNSLRTHVLSVACGQSHTLALTENGLYSWGSSRYGQLGLGDICQSPYPRLICSLQEHRIVAIAAGQYHSLVLTSTGRVFSWGWGVHGQLGLGSVENQNLPTLISALDGQVVRAIGGGHAHSLFLLSSGQVLGCGSSVFGQLGTGGNSKSSLPTPVCNLPESITSIATGYFHNLAISKSNRLYTWGSSPQVLRMQAQSQKKARLLLQQQLLQQQQQQQQQVQNKKTSPIKISPDQDPKLESLDDQFQIISLKDCEESSDEPNCNSPTSPKTNKEYPSTLPESKSDKVSSPVPTLSKVSNNVRLNGPQEVFEDPLNATFIFPSANICDVEVPTANQNVSPAELSDKQEPPKNVETLLPIPDLLAEAVPKVVVDLVQSSKAVPNLPCPSVPSTDAIVVPCVSMDAESSQIHLLPVLVDTSLVEGLIAEISCGCHHSALVTEEGRVYTWGRNIDGQLGHSGRKEAAIPSLVPEVRAAQIACGADFTLVLHADGQVFGWGSNASAQIGRMPQKEPNKGLEGKTIMLNTSKRVIKIPNSVNNRIESPQEISGIPPSSPTPAYSSTALSAAPAAAWAFELNAMEKPPFGSLTLHIALNRLFPFYQSSTLLKKCLEHGNLQAAGRLSLLAKDIPASLGYYLDALITSWKQNTCLNVNSSASAKEKCSPERNLKLHDQQDTAAKTSSVDTPDLTSSSATLTDENCASSHTENSCDNSETHAFAVQGGMEEMSEGTDSENTKSNQQPSDETSSLASVSLEEQDACLAKSDVLEEPVSGKSSESSEVNQVTKPIIENDLWLKHEILRLIELHMSLIEEEEQDEPVISLLLQTVVSFWVKENMQLSFLEEFICQHWDNLSHPFAVLLFCSDFESSSKLSESLSSGFMMKLCSSMVSRIKTSGECAELNILLTRLMTQKGQWNPSTDTTLSIEEVVEHLTDSAGGGRALHIEPLHDSLDNNNIVAFSCGHQLNWHDYNAEVAAARTEGSASGIVLSDAEDAVFQHACPSCVAQYLQRIKL